jgi:DNA-directed RNA polymerase specialized sigma24 family protein
VVELKGRLSNPEVRRVVRVVMDALGSSSVEPQLERSALRRSRTTPIRHLAADEVVALLERYQAGATVYELAGEFSIHRVTVGKHLRRKGVRLRLDGLDDAQIEGAVHLYGQGWSLAKVGKHLGVAAGTVRKVLMDRGVRMRDSHGRGR